MSDFKVCLIGLCTLAAAVLALWPLLLMVNWSERHLAMTVVLWLSMPVLAAMIGIDRIAENLSAVGLARLHKALMVIAGVLSGDVFGVAARLDNRSSVRQFFDLPFTFIIQWAILALIVLLPFVTAALGTTSLRFHEERAKKRPARGPDVFVGTMKTGEREPICDCGLTYGRSAFALGRRDSTNTNVRCLGCGQWWNYAPHSDGTVMRWERLHIEPLS